MMLLSLSSRWVTRRELLVSLRLMCETSCTVVWWSYEFILKVDRREGAGPRETPFLKAPVFLDLGAYPLSVPVCKLSVLTDAEATRK